MALRLSVVKERQAGERRVALSPESAKKLIALGFQISLEPGAGAASHILDSEYESMGVTLDASLQNADVVLCVQPPAAEQVAQMQQGAHLIGLLAPLQNKDQITAYAKHNLAAYAMELMPRITRAQTMDVLSSQSNLAGYKSVLDATEHYGRALPMMMTAAGTIPAARVFVLGAGVAGLQAIATAKRLGAIVSATDVRAAAAEQVESLGASFIMVKDEDDDSGETAGGYAKEMTAEQRQRQATLVAEHLRSQNIVICTALVFGRSAPRLIDKAMVESMAAGSVIVDLAVEQGGNCEMSKAGEVVDHKGVRIIGHKNMASRLAGNASALYARNLYHFLEAFYDKETQSLQLDGEDEILQAVRLCAGGKLVHPLLTAEKKGEAS